MPGLWIDDVILALDRPFSDKCLLSRICFRAGIRSDSTCWDSNVELGKSLNMHFMTVSRLVNKLDELGLIKATVHDKLRNTRSIAPLAQLLKPYRDNAERYRQLMDFDYKQSAYSTPPSAPPAVSTNRLEGIRNVLTPYTQSVDSTIHKSLIPYTQNADSLYKDRKPIENSSENSTLHTVVVVENAHPTNELLQPVDAEEKEKKDPPRPPLKIYGDGKLQEEVREIFLKHRKQYGTDPYSPEMIPKFLDYYTAIVQNSEKTNENGKELHRTYLTWNTTKKLEQWHNTKLDDERKRQQSSTGRAPEATSTIRGSTGATGAGKRPVKRTPTITADKLCRDSQTSRNTDPGGDGRTISINVE